MTPLRQRMIEDLQLRGYSARTQEAYVHVVRQPAAHFHCSPDRITEEPLRQYVLHLTNVKKFAPASFTIALCGITCFVERTLGRDWTLLALVRPAREKTLPVVLSRDEVRRILGGVRLPGSRACLATMYVCGLLMTAAAAALLTLTADPRYLGGCPGLLAVLHTWTRALLYHPHVHILVTAGGLHRHARTWVPAKRPAFLVPGRALSRLFRAKFRDALRKAGLLDQAPTEVWSQEGVVHLQHAGTGEKVLEYLARYVFRIALVDSRLERFDDGRVTFRYRDGRTGTTKRCTLDAITFISRFLQHVLPQGFSKVRHYGLFSPSRKPLLEHTRAELVAPPPSAPPPALVATNPASVPVVDSPPLPRCPFCGHGVLRLVETLPRWGLPP